MMADGSVKAIGKLQLGDMVMGADAAGMMAPARVTHIFDSGVKPVYRFVYRYGSYRTYIQLLATAEHKVLQETLLYGYKTSKYNNEPRILPAAYKKAMLFAVHPTAVSPVDGMHIADAYMLGAFIGAYGTAKTKTA